MKNTLLLMCAGLLVVSSISTATDTVDPDDAMLMIYVVTDEEADSFSTSDGKVTSWWTDNWAGGVVRDEIKMTERGGYAMANRNNFAGDDDATLIIRAAASPSGLFLYCEVIDNIWVDPVEGNSIWEYDAVDIYIDTMTSADILSCGDLCHYQAYFPWSLSYSTQQIQMNMGASSPPLGFTFQYYDTYSWLPKDVMFSQTAADYDGMSIEIIEVAGKKVQEWYIPWKWVGNGRLGTPTFLPEDYQFAFSGGYNDRDRDGVPVSSLRWQGTPSKSDPYAGDSWETWGDLNLVAPLYPIDPTAATIRKNRFRAAAAGDLFRTEYYNLKGERLSVSAARLIGGGNNGVVLQKNVYKQGVSSIKRADQIR